MRFAFEDTHIALRDMSRNLFTKESPPERLRELWAGGCGGSPPTQRRPFDRSVWRKMAAAGLCGITVPEAYGGAGGNEIDLTLVYEEAGRAGLPEPLLETTGVAAPVIAELGTEDVRERWLPGIASGETIAAVQPPGEDVVAWGAEADLLLHWHGDEVHALDSQHFKAQPVMSTDHARPMAAVEARPDETTLLGTAAFPARGVFGTAAILNGVCLHLLETTTEYVKDRRQFGRPVGSFQAVKHKLASMHIAIETSRPAAWYAGYAIAKDLPDAAEAASVAKLVAVRTETLCNTEALQCHGGIGFTWEHDLHLWLKRGIALRSAFGGATEHVRRLRTAVMPDA